MPYPGRWDANQEVEVKRGLLRSQAGQKDIHIEVPINPAQRPRNSKVFDESPRRKQEAKTE